MTLTHELGSSSSNEEYTETDPNQLNEQDEAVHSLPLKRIHQTIVSSSSIDSDSHSAALSSRSNKKQNIARLISYVQKVFIHQHFNQQHKIGECSNKINLLIVNRIVVVAAIGVRRQAGIC